MSTSIITGGITTTNLQNDITPLDLAPNNYLTIIWKDSKTGNIVNTLDTNTDEEVKFTTELNNAINQGIESGKVNYVGQSKYVNLESIAKYLSQNIISSGAKRQVVNTLIGIGLGSGDIVPDKVINTCLNVFGDIADKTARNLGLSDPHELFSQVAGENTLAYFKELGKNTKNTLENAVKKINNNTLTKVATKVGLFNNGNSDSSVKRYVGLVLGLTTSDTESYEITIPKRKVENGSDYATHLLPQNYKKDFTVKLTNKVLTANYSYEDEINAIEFTKNKLIEIANSHTLFDIYIRLSSNKIYKKENVSFTSLSFDKSEDSGNGYTCTFSIEPVKEFKTKVFVSNKKYSSSKGSGSSGKGSSSARIQKDKTTSGNSIKVAYGRTTTKMLGLKKTNELAKTESGNISFDTFSNIDEAKQYAKNNGLEIMQCSTYPNFVFYNKNQVEVYKGVKILKRDMENIPYGAYGYYRRAPKTRFNVYTTGKDKGKVASKTGGSVYKILD